MALLDNKEYALAFIRNAFVSSDDTEMCEHVLENNGYVKNRRLNKKQSQNKNTEDNPDSELPNSLEIIANMDIDSHRRRSDTAQRLERMKRDKHRLSQIQHITWGKNEDENNKSNSPDDNDMFKRKEIVLHIGPRFSLLSQQLNKITAIPQNPFNDYIKFDGKSATNGAPVKKIKIYLTMVSERDRPYPLTVCCLASARVCEFVGLICWHYTCTGLLPVLHKTSQAYALHIAEDDGEMDRDFPALEFNEPLSKYGFTRLALVEREKTLWCISRTIVVTINMPGRGFSKIPLEDTTIKMKEILKQVLAKRRIILKNGINYRLEEQDTPGVVVDLDLPLNAMPTFDFCLVRENSVRGTDGTGSSTDENESCPLVESLTSHQYKTYNVDQLLRLWKRTPIQLGVSGDNIEMMECTGRQSSLGLAPWRVRSSTSATRHVIAISAVVNCCLLEPRHSGKAVFRFDYMPPPTGNAGVSILPGERYKHYTFECGSRVAYEIVRKICCCIEQQIDLAARNAYLAYRASQRKKK